MTIEQIAEDRAREIDPMAWAPSAFSTTDQMLMADLKRRREISLQTALRQIEAVATRLLTTNKSYNQIGGGVPIDSRLGMAKPHIKKKTKRRK